MDNIIRKLISPLVLLLDKLTGLLLGKGFIDQKFPFLMKIFKVLFARLQKGETTVFLPQFRLKFIVNNQDMGVGLYLRTQKKYEPIQSSLLLSLIKNDDVLFDIGANTGYYTLLAANKPHFKGKIVAIEPDKFGLNLLERNLKLNNIKCNLTIVNKALSNQHRFLSYHYDKYSPSNSFTSNKTSNNTVEATTLDKIISELNLEKINIMVIDIEGAEIDCLRGGQKKLKELTNLKLFIECNPAALKRHGDSVDTLVNTLEETGFKIENIINEFSGKIETYSKEKLFEVFERYSYVSLLAKK